jgi:hypothetical protein
VGLCGRRDPADETRGGLSLAHVAEQPGPHLGAFVLPAGV